MTIAALDQARRERLLRICREGAAGAGSALATFVGKPDASTDVDVLEADSADALARHVAGDEAVVVGFELSGDAGGVLIAMLSASAIALGVGALTWWWGRPAEGANFTRREATSRSA